MFTDAASYLMCAYNVSSEGDVSKVMHMGVVETFQFCAYVGCVCICSLCYFYMLSVCFFLEGCLCTA